MIMRWDLLHETEMVDRVDTNTSDQCDNLCDGISREFAHGGLALQLVVDEKLRRLLPACIAHLSQTVVQRFASGLKQTTKPATQHERNNEIWSGATGPGAAQQSRHKLQR